MKLSLTIDENYIAVLIHAKISFVKIVTEISIVLYYVSFN